MKETIDSLLDVSKPDQYRTVGELIEKSRPSQNYYVLLVLSAIIIAGGVLTNNLPIIIGGMLVAPLLTPILAIALGFSVGKVDLIFELGGLVTKSVAIVVGGSLVMGFVFGQDVIFPVVTNSMIATFLFFVVATASGIAVTYAWIRKEASEVLPGIAIVVSLVPPLSYIGVSLSQGEWNITVTYLIIFVLNLIGIVLGSLSVFLLSQFGRVSKAVERKHDQVIEEEKEEKEERQEKIKLAENEEQEALKETKEAQESTIN